MRSAADTVIETAKHLGCGLEAMQAVRAMATENKLKDGLDEARAATDAAIANLKAKADGGLSNGDIATLLGVPDRQTIHMRSKRHTKAMDTKETTA